MAVFPALTSLHGHLALGFVCIGIQMALLVQAVRFLMLAKRAQKS